MAWKPAFEVILAYFSHFRKRGRNLIFLLGAAAKKD